MMKRAIQDNMPENTGDGIDKRLTLVIIATAAFVQPLLMFSVNVALPSIGREFALEAVALSWVANAFLLANAAFMIPLGRLADIYGLKKMYLFGFLLLTLSSLACALSTSAVMLIVFEFVQGISGAMTIGTGVAILTSVFPPSERGRVLGINTGMVYLGLTLGPFIGGILTEHLGWRSIFYLSAALGLMVAAGVLWKFRGEWAGARGEKFDYPGAVVFILAILVVVYGFSNLNTVPGIALLLLGLLGIVGFVWRASRTEQPVFNIRLFRNNPVFSLSNLAQLINYVAVFGATFMLNLYLQYIKGFSPQSAGLILAAAPCVQVICAPLAGRISDKIEPRLVASLGLAFNFIAIFMLSFLGDGTVLWYIVVSFAVTGIGMGFFAPANTNAVMGSVEKKFLGIASGAVGTMRTLGQVLGVGVIMILFSIFIGDARITPESYPAFLTSFRVGYIIFIALGFVNIFVQLASRKPRATPS